MAYQTGTVNSLADIQTVIRTFLVDNGWTWDTGSGTIYKDDMFVTFVAPSDDKVLFQAKTALSGGSSAPRDVGMGRMVFTGAGNVPAVITYPAAYWAFLADDEFYFVVNYDVSRYQYVSWGCSTVDLPAGASGMFVSGTVSNFAPRLGYTNRGSAITLGATSGGGTTDNEIDKGARSAAPFWDTRQGANPDLTSDFVMSNFDGDGWRLSATISSGYTTPGVGHVGSLMGVIPNAWNGESPLLPIRAYKRVAESKVSLVLDLRHARYCRVDNFNDAEIITIGPDQWQVFPFHRRNPSARNGGESIDHTGTFGWAIRKVD